MSNFLSYADFSDDFTRSDSLNWGKNWICTNSYSVDTSSGVGGKILSNKGRVYNIPFSGVTAAFYAIPLTGILLNGPLNHFCEARITAHVSNGGASNQFGVGVSGYPVSVFDHTNLLTVPGGSYWCRIRGDIGLQMELTKLNYQQTGQFSITSLVALGFDTYVLGDLLRLEVRYTASSTNLTVYRNGVVKTTYSDNTGSRFITGCPILPFSLNQTGDLVDYSFFHGGLL